MTAAIVAVVLTVGLVAWARTWVRPVQATSAPSASVTAIAPSSSAVLPLNTMRSVLERQSAALVRGDEVGFVLDVDPAKPAAVAQYRELFATLRALKVTGWRAETNEPEQTVALRAPAGPVKVQVRYCLGTPRCPVTDGDLGATSMLEMKITFGVNGDRVLITSLVPPAQSDIGSAKLAPWQTASLSVAAGQRVIVAISSSMQWRLPLLLREAEAAAAVVDRYAKWTRPAYYYVYVARPVEWKVWFGNFGALPDVAGSAIPTSKQSVEVVVRDEVAKGDFLPVLFRHEMAHVATLLGGKIRTDLTDLWVVEGVAEHVAYDSSPTQSPESRLDVLRDYRRAGKWHDSLEVRADIRDDPRGEAAFYAASYLAVRYLTERFGEQKLFEFIGHVLQDGERSNIAALLVFNVHWDELGPAIITYIQQQSA